MVPTDQKSADRRRDRGAVQPRRAVPHLPFITPRLRQSGAKQEYLQDKNPALWQPRTRSGRNLHFPSGLAESFRQGNCCGIWLGTEVRQQTTFRTHSPNRFNSHPSSHSADELAVPVGYSAHRHHNTHKVCVRGAPAGCLGRGFLRSANRHGVSLTLPTASVTFIATRYYPTYRACGVCRRSTHLHHREGPLR